MQALHESRLHPVSPPKDTTSCTYLFRALLVSQNWMQGAGSWRPQDVVSLRNTVEHAVCSASMINDASCPVILQTVYKKDHLSRCVTRKRLCLNPLIALNFH